MVRELQRRLGGDFPGNPDPEKAAWLIIDDETPGVKFGEGWKFINNANGGQVGEGSHFPPGGECWGVELKRGIKGADDPVYPLPVVKKGTYTLLGRVPYQHSAHADSKTVFEIVSGGVTNRFDANQAISTGDWLKLGEFELSPESTLRIITSESYGTVIADGFALVP
jgi:hypothetical protein